MPVYHTQPEFTLHHDDNRNVLATLADGSIDSVVCDPPYEIGFMAKGWDSSGIAYSVDLWREHYRVLKPGGYLVAFGGTRTYHRMACAIEEAGFEIRDQLAWMYGSGFPKSLDVSKAIDGADKIGTVRVRSLRFTEFMRSTGLTSAQINDATESSMASHYLTAREQPEVATESMFSKLRGLISARGILVPPDIEELVAWRTVESENMKRRRVVGIESMTDFTQSRPVSLAAQGLDVAPRRDVAITEAHTEAAKKWEGWGTALKPAWEPIVLARKPLDGTVADNVMAYGTGAINVGGCRVPFAGSSDESETKIKNQHAKYGSKTGAQNTYGDYSGVAPKDYEAIGRWPANILHDGSPDVLEHFPNEEGASASRFFYCAKTDTRDREEGCEDLPLVAAADLVGRAEGSAGMSSPRAGAGVHSTGRRNVHPTVKPTELMRWLVRLVTRPGGVTFDGFTGSGSTGKACVLEGVRFIGAELGEEHPEYLAIATARIKFAALHRDRWAEIHAAPAAPENAPGQGLLFA